MIVEATNCEERRKKKDREKKKEKEKEKEKGKQNIWSLYVLMSGVLPDRQLRATGRLTAGLCTVVFYTATIAR